ncbi:ABC transporter permease [Enterococcus sp. CWB-B31]|uniref:ABC transporter permease n=1 Tax=Enterococcus sp. CWB-B31 TaxID=2885159 RepID=UPI001E59D05C|nr:ABC transporter permease [Enterococcus sp. CWB-B31]MCB5953805.1 ABC transporter permease [Enterococcus sp. CWB-B31]
MTIYNAILQILKKNKGSLLLGVIITFAVTFLYSSSSSADVSNLETAAAAIIDEDNSELSKALASYIEQRADVMKLENNQKSKDDALYFRQTDYILTIKKGFASKLSAGKIPMMEVQTRPDSFSKSLMDTYINNYLNTYLDFQKAADMETSELIKTTNKSLISNGKVVLNANHAKKQNRLVTARVFNLLAYGLFTSIFSGYAVINLAFNRPEIKHRNNCSPISKQKLSRRISIGMLGYSVTITLAFIIYMLIFTRSGFNAYTGYTLLNTAVFFIVMVSFSTFITSFIHNNEAIGGINNVFIMGSCFSGGIFVPASIMPAFVLKIGSFTPTYWFARTNELIAESAQLNADFQKDVLFNLMILLCFATAFFILNLAVLREKKIKSTLKMT